MPRLPKLQSFLAFGDFWTPPPPTPRNKLCPRGTYTKMDGIRILIFAMLQAVIKRLRLTFLFCSTTFQRFIKRIQIHCTVYVCTPRSICTAQCAHCTVFLLLTACVHFILYNMCTLCSALCSVCTFWYIYCTCTVCVLEEYIHCTAFLGWTKHYPAVWWTNW